MKKKQIYKIRGYKIPAYSLKEDQRKLDGYYLLKSVSELN